jgi:hypothetical protein
MIPGELGGVRNNIILAAGQGINYNAISPANRLVA